jgi:hypothetical protein
LDPDELRRIRCMIRLADICLAPTGRLVLHIAASLTRTYGFIIHGNGRSTRYAVVSDWNFIINKKTTVPHACMYMCDREHL